MMNISALGAHSNSSEKDFLTNATWSPRALEREVGNPTSADRAENLRNVRWTVKLGISTHRPSLGMETGINKIQGSPCVCLSTKNLKSVNHETNVVISMEICGIHALLPPFRNRS